MESQVEWMAISNGKPTRMEGATSANDAGEDWAHGPFGCMPKLPKWKAIPKVELFRSHSDWNHSRVIRSGGQFGMDSDFE